MAKGDHLVEYKQLALTAVMVLGENAYGGAIHKRMQELAAGSMPVALAVVYATLDRLEKQGYLWSWFGGATKERGGRSKKFFQITPAGEKALRDSLVVARNLLRELE
jgi:DNA-binding PadR family transcriptional regulator